VYCILYSILFVRYKLYPKTAKNQTKSAFFSKIDLDTASFVKREAYFVFRGRHLDRRSAPGGPKWRNLFKKSHSSTIRLLSIQKLFFSLFFIGFVDIITMRAYGAILNALIGFYGS